MVAPEQALDLIDSTFGQLRHELLPVPVLNLEETCQVVSLEEHQSDKAPIQLLVALDFVLKLAALVAVQLFLVHGQS